MFKTKTAEPEAPWIGQRWEYITVKSIADKNDELNRLGQQGWELVAFPGSGRAAVLKRPLN